MVKYIHTFLKASMLAILVIAVSQVAFLSPTNVSVSHDFQETSDYQVGVISVEENHMLPQKWSASRDEVGTQVYKAKETFLSNWISADAPFHALGMSWEEEVFEGSDIEFFVRTRKLNGQNSKWTEVEKDIDAKADSEIVGILEEGKHKYYSFLNTAWSTHIQYKVELSSKNTDTTPAVSDIEFTYINSKAGWDTPGIDEEKEKPVDIEKAEGGGGSEAEQVSEELSVEDLVASLKITDKRKGMNIISRKSWGANESLRVFSGLGKPTQIEVNEEIQEKYADEIKLRKEIKKNEKGKLLVWPLQYPMKDIQAVFVHHTASQEDAIEDSYAAMRAIYYYHSVTRGWGDIGYNFLIDGDGNVFEGRAGGDKVVGAHTANYNVGSVGVAVIGNYQEDEVESGSVTGLIELLTQLSEKYTLDPLEIVRMRGENIKVISGHRDAIATVCPGKNLYTKMPYLRQLVRSELVQRGTYTGEEEVLKPVNGVDFKDSVDRNIVIIGPEEKKTITIKLTNSGSKNWGRTTSLVYRNGGDNLAGFQEVVARLKESQVRTHQVGTFDIPIQGSFASGLKNYYLNLQVGTSKSERRILLPVYIEPAKVAFELLRFDKMPKFKLEKRETTKVTFTLQNKGNVTWDSNRMTIKSASKDSLFATGRMITKTPVSPGGVAVFEVGFKAGATSGRFEEKLNLMLNDGRGNLISSQKTQDFNFTVKGSSVKAGEKIIVVDSSVETIFKSGQKKRMWIEVQNNSNDTWKRAGVDRIHIAILKSPWIKVSNVLMHKAIVKPGESTKVYFDVKAPDRSGKNFINFIFRYQTNRLKKQPIRFDFTVEEGSLKSEPEVNKRIGTRSETQTVVEDLRPLPTQVPTIGPPPVTDVKVDQPTNYINRNITKRKNNIKSPVVLGDKIRVALSFRGNPLIEAESNIRIYDSSGKHLNSGIPITGRRINIAYTDGKYVVRFGEKTVTTEKYVRLGTDGGIIRINNYENRPTWNKELNDNEFRGVLEVRWVKDDAHPKGGELMVINELPMEQYLLGIAEVSNGDPSEKIKALMVAARSYAQYYVNNRNTENAKFLSKPYDLNDDPEVSQKYIGYGLEKRSPNIVRAVANTRGKVVTYKGNVVKTPYFNSTDGTDTKSAEEVWGWTHTPYLQSIADPLCSSTVFNGHGVGLSGCGATEAAKRGYSYEEILKYYYTDIEITDLY